MTDLLPALISHLHGTRSAHRWKREEQWHIACPECAHVSTDKDFHCSMSVYGWKCFSCGTGGTLENLARRTKLDNPGLYTAPVRLTNAEVRHDPPPWTADPERLIAGYEAHPRRFELWAKYKPVTRETITRLRWGVGRLPAGRDDETGELVQNRCQHERLIIPVYDGTMLVALRGRALNCSCPKWLPARGSVLSSLPMYGEHHLRTGQIVWLVENMVDAELFSERMSDRNHIALAIYSTSYWRDEWAETLAAAHPQAIVICLDNDLVGNGGAARRQEFIARYLADPKHGGKYPEVPNAFKIQARLKGHVDCPVMIYDWKTAEYKADIGSLLEKGAIE